MLPLEPSELQGDIINCEKFPWPVRSMYTYFMEDRRGAAPGVSGGRSIADSQYLPHHDRDD
jgi:hypothetical protein